MQKKQTSSILPPKSGAKDVSKSSVKDVVKTAVKNAVKSKSRTKTQTGDKNTVSSNRLKLLVTIVNRNKAEFYLDLIQSFDVNMQCVLLGRGTADKSMLGLLGLTDSDKSVLLGVIQESKVADALSTLESKFSTIKGGKGVACTLPVSSVIGALIYGFLSNNRQTVKKEASNGKR